MNIIFFVQHLALDRFYKESKNLQNGIKKKRPVLQGEFTKKRRCKGKAIMQDIISKSFKAAGEVQILEPLAFCKQSP